MMAIILSTILASYLDLALSQLKLANQEKYENTTQRLVENGMELGLFLLNYEFRDADLSSTPSTFVDEAGNTWALNWTAKTATTTITKNLGSNRTAYTTIVIDNFDRDITNYANTAISAETVIKDGENDLITRRRIVADMEPRSIFPYGFVFTQELEYRNDWLKIRSFRPNTPGGYGVKVGGDYDYTYDDNVTVGATIFDNASTAYLDLYGKAIVEDITGSGMDLGTGTKIQDQYTLNPGSNLIDYGLFHEGFTYEFPEFEAPSLTDSNVVTLDFPGNQETLGDVVDSGYDATTGVYHYKIEGDLNIYSGETLYIQNDVVLEVTDDFRIYSNAKMIVQSGASLVLYVGDDMYVYRGELDNQTADPSKLLIVDVDQPGVTESETWTIYSDTDVHAGLYAGENAYIRFYGSDYWKSSGKFYGAAIGRFGRTYGEMEMYYDEDIFENILSDVRGLDHTYSFNPVSWTETNSSSYLAGDPNP